MYIYIYREREIYTQRDIHYNLIDIIKPSENPGGSVLSGLAVYDTLQHIKSPAITARGGAIYIIIIIVMITSTSTIIIARR